ncbi:DotA/TraY family protein [Vibrio breoganii]
MNNNNKTLWIFIATLFALVSGSASAADPSATISAILNMEPAFDAGNEDNVEYFHLWLRYLFGSFIFKPWTGDNGDISILSTVLGFTNVIAIAFMVVVMTYVIGGGAINTAHSGEVLGKQWSTGWMPIRTAFGVGVLMPVPGLGGGIFSFVQLGIIWLVIFGSNAGTYLWSLTADKLQTQGIYEYTPVGTSTSNTKNVVDMFLCSEFAAIEQSGRVNSPAELRSTYKLATLQYYPVDQEVGIGGQSLSSLDVNIPLVARTGDVYSYRTSGIAPLINQFASTDRSIVTVTFNNGCGSISNLELKPSSVEPKTLSPDSDSAMQREFNGAIAAARMKFMGTSLSALFSSSYNLANDIVSLKSGNPESALNDLKTRCSTGSCVELQAQLKSYAERYFSIAQSFEASANYVGKRELSTALNAINENYKDNYKRGGWAGAGLWYMKVAQSSKTMATNIFNDGIGDSIADSICTVNSQAGAGSMWGFFGSDNVKKNNDYCERANKQLVESKAILAEIDGSIRGSSLIVDAETQIESDVSPNVKSLLDGCTGTAKNCEITSKGTDALFSNVAKGAMNTLLLFSSGSVSGGFMDVESLQNPFVTLTAIGQRLNDLGLLIVGVIATLFTAEAIGSNGLLNALTGGLSGTGGALGALAGKFMLPVTIYLLSIGFTFAYLIPFLPVIAWVNMIVGYLITVIEAVVASPLAAVQLLLPEGTGILGTRLERAMQLIIVIMIKPTLMIIGLLASLTVASIAFSIFNHFFWEGAAVGLRGSPFDMFALLGIYATAALGLVKLIVAIQYTLPTHILDWFAAGVGGRTFGEGNVADQIGNTTSQMKGSVQRVGQSLGSGLMSMKGDPNDEPTGGGSGGGLKGLKASRSK